MDESELKKIYEVLAISAEPSDWDQRRELVVNVSSKWDHLTTSQKEAAGNLFICLANDNKWEVRKAVADQSHLVDEKAFKAISSLISEDRNAFVKKSMDRQISRRRTAREDFEVLRDERSVYAEQLALFKQKYGEMAHKEALTIGENLCSIVTGSIAHNLRNICLPLINKTRTVLKKHAGKGHDSEAVSIEHSLQLLNNTLKDIEDYASQPPQNKTIEGIHEVLCRAIEMARENTELLDIDTSNVKVSIGKDDGSKFKISREPFLIALANIIKNAYESFLHSKSDTAQEIKVTFQIDAEKVIIEISDTGIGISSKDIQMITTFIPNRSNKSKKQSRGFGLPTARRTIQAHDGEISIMSQVGHGATVRIILPSIMDTEEI